MIRRCRCLSFAFFVIHVSYALNLAPAQEKIRLDDNTHKIVNSPWQLQPAQTDASLRGLHVVTSTIMWASGSGGTVLNTIDGGESWGLSKIEGAEELDIRDIHAIDEATVVAMVAGSPARIYRSTNAGRSWKPVFESTDPRVFFDAISFLDDRVGIAMSDPVDGRLFLLKTSDGGLTWNPLKQTPATFPKEGGFAASGTNLTIVGKTKVLIGLGSGIADQTMRSRVVYSDDDMNTWVASAVPLPRHETAGIFSVAFANHQDGVIVGGDYKQPDSIDGNYALSHDGGKTWFTPNARKPPSGYRSCVAAWLNDNEISFITVGPNGTDLSTDLGESWSRISNEGFNAIQFSSDGKQGWAVGANGRVGKWLGR